jgi:hypothetical protein
MFRSFLLITLLVVLCTAPLATASVLDQEHWLSTVTMTSRASNYEGTFRKAQTFTAGVTEALAGVEVHMSIVSVSEILIRPTSGGVPTMSVLASSSDLTMDGNSVYADFTSADLDLSAGGMYAIEIISGDYNNNYGTWSSEYAGSYAGGSGYYINTEGSTNISDWTSMDGDHFLRTYMVPEPTTLGFLGIAGVVLLRRRLTA